MQMDGMLTLNEKQKEAIVRLTLNGNRIKFPETRVSAVREIYVGIYMQRGNFDKAVPCCFSINRELPRH